MELPIIDTQYLINYETGKEIAHKKFRVHDFSIPHELATKQAGFALRFSDDKRDGYYVEIGSSHWKKDNNTVFLEQEFGWKGIGIELQEGFVKEYNENRTNPCVQGDAMSFNWDKYFEENNFPKQIDFLQIDIDHKPTYANLFALLNLPLSRYRFNTIVIEHAGNLDPELARMREIQSQILHAYGYKIIAKGYVDDFYIDPFSLNLSESNYDLIGYETYTHNYF